MANIFDNYIFNKKYEMLDILIKTIGFTNLTGSNFLSFHEIQTKENEDKILKMLPALRTVYKTYHIRSITHRRNDKRFVLNLLRQILKHMGYQLESKTYHLQKNGSLTSSTKYRIVQVCPNQPEFPVEYHQV